MNSTTAVPQETRYPCSIKLLPQQRWIEAAGKAAEINPANAVAHHIMTQMPNQDITTVRYYNHNNNGFGALYRFPVKAPENRKGSGPTGSCPRPEQWRRVLTRFDR